MGKELRKISGEAVLTAVLVPVAFWFFSFVLSSYQSFAEVSNIKEDIKEIKADVKTLLRQQREVRNDNGN